MLMAERSRVNSSTAAVMTLGGNVPCVAKRPLVHFVPLPCVCQTTSARHGFPRQPDRWPRCGPGLAARSCARLPLPAEALEARQRPRVALPQAWGERVIVLQALPPISGVVTLGPAM